MNNQFFSNKPGIKENCRHLNNSPNYSFFSTPTWSFKLSPNSVSAVMSPILMTFLLHSQFYNYRFPSVLFSLFPSPILFIKSYFGLQYLNVSRTLVSPSIFRPSMFCFICILLQLTAQLLYLRCLLTAGTSLQHGSHACSLLHKLNLMD